MREKKEEIANAKTIHPSFRKGVALLEMGASVKDLWPIHESTYDFIMQL